MHIAMPHQLYVATLVAVARQCGDKGRLAEVDLKCINEYTFRKLITRLLLVVQRFK